MSVETPSNLIDTRLVNAPIFNAQPSQKAMEGPARFAADAGGTAAPGHGRVKGPLSRMFRRIMKGELGWFRKRQGGLWVGGKAILPKTELSFTPNRLNAAIHASSERLGWTVPLAAITAVVFAAACLPTSSRSRQPPGR